MDRSSGSASLLGSAVRADLPGRFSELDVLQSHWSRWTATLAGEVLPPYEVLIHPSSSCNLRCAWCIGDHVPLELWDEEADEPRVIEAAKFADERLPDRLDPESMLRLAQELVDYRVSSSVDTPDGPREETFGVRNVSFSGLIGEPLVARRALVPTMHLLADNGLRVGIFTNGVLIDERVMEALLRIGYVHLSLDAATPETYGRLKLGGRPAGELRFRRALANLQAICEERRRRPGCSLEVNASFVLYPENHEEVYDAAVLLREAGVDTLRLKRDNSGDRPLSPPQRRRVAELVGRIRADLEDEDFRLIEIHRLDDDGEMRRTFSRCSITNLMAAIGSDGCMYPCNYHPRPGGVAYGNVIEEGFRSVWEGSRRRQLRERLPSICPKVCDPFKNRSNRLLEVASAVAASHGLDEVRRRVSEMAGDAQPLA